MKEKMFKNMGYLVALFDVAIYFIASYIFVDDFLTNVPTILFNGALLFIGAMIANSAMLKQGLLTGGESKKYTETVEAHIKQKTKIFPKLPKLQAWLDNDYSKLTEIGRTVYVNSAGYDYCEIFTDRGKVKDDFTISKPEKLKKTKWFHFFTVPIKSFFRWMFSDDWKLYRQKKRLVRKATRYKITRLKVSDIINVDADKDPNDFGISESEYVRRQTGLAFITRLVFSILFPSITFGFYGFNIETFVVQLLNIMLILLSAMFSMFSAYVFKTKTLRTGIIRKINKMEEFDNANLTEIKKISEEKENVSIHSEKSLPAKGDLVQEVCGNSESGEKNYLPSNANSGI